MGDMTNYQQIRIMNKKGFAEWMSGFITCPRRLRGQLEAWLDQEAE